MRTTGPACRGAPSVWGVRSLCQPLGSGSQPLKERCADKNRCQNVSGAHQRPRLSCCLSQPGVNRGRESILLPPLLLAPSCSPSQSHFRCYFLREPFCDPVMSFSYRPLEHPDFSPMALITVVLNHVFVFLPGPTLSSLSKTSSKRVMQAATGAGPWLPWLTNPFRATFVLLSIYV